MAEETESQESGMSAVKKAIIGAITTAVTAGGAWFATHLGGGEETKDEVKTEQAAPAAAPVINLNVENNSTNTGTRLGTVMSVPEGDEPAGVSAPPPRPQQAPPPPSRRNQAPAANAANELNATVTVDLGNEQPVQMTIAALRAAIESGKLLPKDVYVLQGNSWVEWESTAGGLPF